MDGIGLFCSAVYAASSVFFAFDAKSIFDDGPRYWNEIWLPAGLTIIQGVGAIVFFLMALR
jgi:hypothetical protein